MPKETATTALSSLHSVQRSDGRDELRRRFVEAARRAQIVTIVNLARSEAELGELFTAELCEAFEAEIAFVLAASEGKAAPALVGAHGLGPDQCTELPYDERCAHALTFAEPRVYEGDLLGIGVRQLVLAPFAGEVDRGVVGVARLYDEPFDEGEVALLEAVSESLKHALERIRLGKEREDILARERAARREAEERGQAARVLDYVADGVFLVDAEGVLQLWNPAAVAITGIPAEAALGRSVEEVLSRWEALAPALTIASAPAVSSGPATLPFEIEDRELWLSIAGVRSADGTVYAFCDRTEEQRLEELEADFIAIVSHELRTPIAAVHGAARTLEREDVDFTDDLRGRLLSIISDQSERLAHLVNNILLTSQVDAERLVLASEQVDVSDVARRVIDATRAHAPDEVSIELVAPPELAPVSTDRDKLRQVLANLVGNAVKYSQGAGRVEVRLDSDRDHVLIAVRDEGLGIPPAEQERIFEKFHRLPSTNRAVSGTGLGLYICRELVGRMGGRIWVESNEGTGSTFFVELPVSSASTGTPSGGR